jgi:hypothetical protein
MDMSTFNNASDLLEKIRKCERLMDRIKIKSEHKIDDSMGGILKDSYESIGQLKSLYGSQFESL